MTQEKYIKRFELKDFQKLHDKFCDKVDINISHVDKVLKDYFVNKPHIVSVFLLRRKPNYFAVLTNDLHIHEITISNDFSDNSFKTNIIITEIKEKINVDNNKG